MRLFFLPLCLLSLIICSSDNTSSKQLALFAQALEPSEARQLWYKSARLGNLEAAGNLLASAISDDDEYWLTQLAYLSDIESNANASQDINKALSVNAIEQGSAALGFNISDNQAETTINTIKSEAAYALANHSQGERDKRYWFDVAAQLNHPQSQFELSLIIDDDAERLRLLHGAASNDYVPAIITLGHYYHHNVMNLDALGSGDSEWKSTLPTLQADSSAIPAADGELAQEDSNRALALYWLERSATYDGDSAFELAMLQWELGQPKAANQNFELAASLGIQKAYDYLEVLQQYKIRSLTDVFLSEQQYTNNIKANWCSQQLQFVASALSSVVQALNFKRQFEQDNRFRELSICINPIVWLPKNALACQNESINARISCNLTGFARIKKQPSFTHLVVFAETGKAYVQRGVMYLDRRDEYSVFVHELAHFAAFVDEYPLSHSMARVHCAAPTAPNLIVSSESEALDQVALQRWHLASEGSLALSVSRTCDRTEGVTSFKPSAAITFLEHHDTEYIPPLYLTLWQQQLGKQSEAIEASYEFLHLANKNRLGQSIRHWQAMLPK